MAQFDEPVRDLVEQLQCSGNVAEGGERTSEVVTGLQCRELLSDRAIERFGFLQIGQCRCELAPAHAYPTPVGQRAGKEE